MWITEEDVLSLLGGSEPRRHSITPLFRTDLREIEGSPSPRRTTPDAFPPGPRPPMSRVLRSRRRTTPDRTTPYTLGGLPPPLRTTPYTLGGLPPPLRTTDAFPPLPPGPPPPMSRVLHSPRRTTPDAFPPGPPPLHTGTKAAPVLSPYDNPYIYREKQHWIGELRTDVCSICNKNRGHNVIHCPFLVLTTQLDVFKKRPPGPLEFRYFYDKYGGGLEEGYVIAPGYSPKSWYTRSEELEALRLHEDGMNLVRIANLQKYAREPEQLLKEVEEFGCVTHGVIFTEQGVALVNFISTESAQNAIKELNCSRFGHLTWATVSPW